MAVHGAHTKEGHSVEENKADTENEVHKLGDGEAWAADKIEEEYGLGTSVVAAGDWNEVLDAERQVRRAAEADWEPDRCARRDEGEELLGRDEDVASNCKPADDARTPHAEGVELMVLRGQKRNPRNKQKQKQTKEDDGGVVGAGGELIPNRSRKGVRWFPPPKKESGGKTKSPKKQKTKNEILKMTLGETIQLESTREASAIELYQGKRLQISP